MDIGGVLIFFLAEFIGVTLVCKTIKVSNVHPIKHHLHTVSCAPCPPKSSLCLHCPTRFAHLHLAPTLLPSGHHHTGVCVSLLCMYIFWLIPLFFSSGPPNPFPLDSYHHSMIPGLCFYFVHQCISFIIFLSETIWHLSFL